MSIKVNDFRIPDWAIERQAQALFQDVAKGMPGKPQEVIRLAALDLAKDRMIDQALMAQESKRRNYEINPTELSRGMKKWMRENGGKKAFVKANNPVIRNQDDLRNEITNQLQFNRLLEEESTCEPVTEEEAKKYYEERPELFRTEETVSASHILKKAENESEYKTAKEEILLLREKLNGGADFTELVRSDSDDKNNDGNLGYFGKGRMVPEFEKVAFSLAEGELSQPVKSQFGWHLILLHQKKAPEVTPFDEVSEKIINYLTERKKDKVFDEFLDRLKNEADITEGE